MGAKPAPPLGSLPCLRKFTVFSGSLDRTVCVTMMMNHFERREEARRLHSDALGLLTRSMRDLRMAYDAAHPLDWLTEAKKRAADAEAVIERLRVFAEGLRPL